MVELATIRFYDLIVLGPTSFSPSEARLAELARRESLAVLVAVFFMVVKP